MITVILMLKVPCTVPKLQNYGDAPKNPFWAERI